MRSGIFSIELPGSYDLVITVQPHDVRSRPDCRTLLQHAAEKLHRKWTQSIRNTSCRPGFAARLMIRAIEFYQPSAAHSSVDTAATTRPARTTASRRSNGTARSVEAG